MAIFNSRLHALYKATLYKKLEFIFTKLKSNQKEIIQNIISASSLYGVQCRRSVFPLFIFFSILIMMSRDALK